MFTKSILTAAALAVALPFAASSSEVNEGKAMQAAILNLDASAFTTNELGQIGGERNNQRRADLAQFILEQKADSSNAQNPGHEMLAKTLNLDPAAFTTNELGQIAGERTGKRQADLAAYILEQKASATVSTLGEGNLR